MKMHSFSANQRGVIFTFTLLIDEHESSILNKPYYEAYLVSSAYFFVLLEYFIHSTEFN